MHLNVSCRRIDTPGWRVRRMILATSTLFQTEIDARVEGEEEDTCIFNTFADGKRRQG